MPNETEVLHLLSIAATTPDGRSVSLEGFEAAYLALCRKGLKGHESSLFEAIKIMLDVGVAKESEQGDKQATIDNARRIAARLGIELPERVLSFR